ncbi:MAG: tripartite tricarboxylate transporter substrate binding protein [Betaproteobacteria bacterium]|nr:tripartite tricarboxylate transporter substrate binding protein [Betaproteobacteria bacterium]
MKAGRSICHASVGLVAAACAAGAYGQTFPAKPVRLVVPFSAGGAVDVVARTFSQKLAESWKQQVVVDYKTGAGGNIASDMVAKSAPNGYTLLLNTAAQAISAAYFRSLPYDPVKDLAPVTQISATYLVLTVNPGVSATSMGEFIALAKAQPGKFNFGSGGLGSSSHLGGELFKSLAAIEVTHVPYKGDAPLTTALLTGEVQFAFMATIGSLPYIKSGKYRALAKTGEKRSALIPEVPTVAESGLPAYQFAGWLGIFAPGGTPRDLAGAISAEFSKTLALPDVTARLIAGGNEPVGSTPDEFSSRYKTDIGIFTKIIRDAKLPLAD